MRREFLTAHLSNCGCYSDSSEPIGEWWVNCINSEECLVPHEPELELTTWGQILYELKVDVPPDFDSDFEVYKLWREHMEREFSKSGSE